MLYWQCSPSPPLSPDRNDLTSFHCFSLTPGLQPIVINHSKRLSHEIHKARVKATTLASLLPETVCLSGCGIEVCAQWTMSVYNQKKK